MIWRVGSSITAAALMLAACASPPTPEVDLTAEFIPFVADSTDNVGLGNAIAVTEDGTPYISYFGFPADVEEGEIATTRPVGSAFIPAVQVATVNLEDGIWSRGAVAQSEEFSGVTVPFGPETLDSLANLTEDNSNGTSIAVDGAGVRHVVWTSNSGIWYASSGDSSSIEQVARYEVSQAGPVGRPGIAVDGEGAPWVAWTASGRTAMEVRVATLVDDAWVETVVAEIGLCNGCPQPSPTRIGITRDGPVVLYADPEAGAVMSARQEAEGWTISELDPDAAGLGLSLAVDPDGQLYAAYFDGQGGVVLAAGNGASWSTAEVAASGEVDDDLGNLAPTTGVAVDETGKISVTWDDVAGHTVRMAQGDGTSFDEVEVPAAAGGRTPSVATSPDGSRVFVAWYDATTQDLLMGLLGTVQDLVVARPSPIQSPGAGGPMDTSCEPDGKDLALSALDQTWDAVSCLAVEAGAKFTVTVDNTSAVLHDFSIYPSSTAVTEGDAIFYGFANPVQAGSDLTYDDIPVIDDPGDYFFRCDFHPTTMTGAFIVA